MLDELFRVMPPPKAPTFNVGDWDAVETALGTRLPTDYKAFIASYGQGWIDSKFGIAIHSPFSFVAYGRDIRQAWVNWADMYHDFVRYGGMHLPYPVFPEGAD